MNDNEVNWIEIAVKIAAARLDDRAQAEAVCRYLRGEVERLGKANALLEVKNLQLESQIKLIKAIDWDNNPCILNYPGEVTHE